MRRAANTVAKSLPAPIGGWNARDSLGEMAENDAVTLTNWWPGTSDVLCRYGYTSQSTGLGTQVETLMAYAGGSTNKMKAATSNGSVYDVTTAGAVGAAELSGLTNGRWQYGNFTTTAGSYLCMVNGADVYRVYDGTAWHKDGDGAPYDITGVTSSTLIHLNVFKSRLWFIQKNTLKAWYLAINSIGGAATSLDLSGVFQMGGSLMAMGTWTVDGGYGVDDYAVWVTTKGEVAVYRLTDPTTPSGIALIGIYRIGSPVGRRCFMKYSGDLLIISQDGVLPLSKALQSSRLDPKISLTDKINYAMSAAVTSYGSNFGWQLIAFPKQNQLYLNVPVSEGSNQQQYVMNTITRNWCNFTGWAANCWEIFNDDLYFGGNGTVGKAWSGLSDNNADISTTAVQAFNYFGNMAAQKRFTMIRPHFFSNGDPSIAGNVVVDFDLQDNTAPLSFSATAYGTWDSAVWDTDIWGSDVVAQSNWQGCNGIGYCGAPILKAAANGIQLRWIATDVVFERGGIL